MRHLIFAPLIFSWIITPTIARASSISKQCVVGSPTVSNFALSFQQPRNSTNSRPSLLQTFQQRYLLTQLQQPPPSSRSKTEASSESFCQNCIHPISSNNLRDLETIAAGIGTAQINSMCVKASLKRRYSVPSKFCSTQDSGAISLPPPGPNGPCITQDMTEYITWSFNQAVSCLNPISDIPLDPFVLFQKFNNETGFKFFTAYSGGVSIGGLTSIAIEELNQESTVMRQVSLYNRPECTPFKAALEERPQNALDYCEWVDIDHGLARSLIYSIAYYLDIRDRQFGNYRVQHQGNKITLREKIKKVAGDEFPTWLNYASLAPYGPMGNAARNKINQVLNSKPKNFEEFKQRLEEQVPYLKNIRQTTDDLTATTPELSDPEQQCIQ